MTADATVVDDEKGRPTTDDVAAAAAEPRRNRKGAAERQRSMRRRRRRRKEAGELLPRIRVRGFASARSSGMKCSPAYPEDSFANSSHGSDVFQDTSLVLIGRRKLIVTLRFFVRKQIVYSL